MALSAEAKQRLRYALNSDAIGTEVSDILNAASATNTTELGYVDGVTAGTAAANKALVLDANKKIATITDIVATNVNATNASATLVAATNVNATNATLSSTLTIGTTAINEADIGKIDGITAGTAAANKALVLGSGGSATLVDGSTFTLGTTNGVIFGAANNDKLGFYGTAAVVQAANIGNTNNNADTLESTVNGILVALRALGLIAPTV